MSQGVTRLYSQLGYVNRETLAGGLRQLHPYDLRSTLDQLVKNGLLKRSQRANLSSLDAIQPYMLRAVNPEQIDELFVGTAKPLENIASGLEAAYATISADFNGAQIHRAQMKTAFLIGAGTAAGIGAFLTGTAGVGLLLGGSTVYGIISSIAVHKANPHSTWGKLFEFGRRILPLSLMANMVYGSAVTFDHGFMFLDAVSDTFTAFHDHLKDVHYFVFGGGLFATLAKSYLDYRRVLSTRMAMLEPLGKKQIFTNILFPNLKILGSINYLSYRTLLFGAFTLMTAAVFYSSVPAFVLPLAGAGLVWRLAINKTKIERWTEAIANWREQRIDGRNTSEVTLADGRTLSLLGKRTSDGVTGVTLTNGTDTYVVKGTTAAEILADLKDHKNIPAQIKTETKIIAGVEAAFKRATNHYFSQIDKLITEYAFGLGVKYLPLLLTTIIPTALYGGSPLALFFDLATVYTGYWALMADWHSGTAGIGSALNFKRSMFNPEDSYISDAMRKGMTATCARMIAYMTEQDRNFSKLINVLTMEYPGTEVNFCGGEAEDPFNLEKARHLRAAREVHQTLRDWQKELYGKFFAAYDRFTDSAMMPADAKAAAADLAVVFDELGQLFSKIDEASNEYYIPHLRAMMTEDKKRPEADRRFKMDGDDPFMRQGFDAVRIRGFRFLEMARYLREANQNDLVTPQDMKATFLDMLKIFTVGHNHVLRKLDYYDDRLGTKTANLSKAETHLGDTLYQVWQLVIHAGKQTLRPAYVPSTYVRVNNPQYNHKKGDQPENQPYLWVRREDYAPVLGLSQAMSNKMKNVDNTPANIATIESEVEVSHEGHPLKVRGFYSNQELLPPHHIIDWEGKTIPTDNLTWIAGQAAPAGFINAFKAWAQVNFKDKPYAEFEAKFGKDALWFCDKPEALILAAAQNYNVCDEAYIVINTERELQAELKYTEEKDKILRVVGYDEWTADYPNPDHNHDVNKVLTWGLQDSSIGFCYTVDGQRFDIPYPENRMAFIEGGGDWKAIAYGLIRGNKEGEYYIEVYDASDNRLGVIKTEWPHHMHPPELIADRRIKINVFEERVGYPTWLVANYGDNYGEKPYERLRFARLDPDTEAKQQFWPNFITSIETYDDKQKGRRLKLKTISTNCATLPFDKRWAGIKMAKEVDQVLEVNSSDEIFIDETTHTWSPVKDARHTKEIKQGSLKMKGLLLVRGADGSEKVAPLTGLPFALATTQEARKVIGAELSADRQSLVFTKLRRDDPLKDNPNFIYSLPVHLYDSSNPSKLNPAYNGLRELLDKHELTVRVEEEKGKHFLHLIDENGTERKVIPADELIDNENRGFLQNSARQMTSLDSFYHRLTADYSGTEEYRPRIVKIEGEIKLVLTRTTKVSVKRSKENETAFSLAAAEPDRQLFFAVPTSSAKIRTAKGKVKWVPLSLTRPISYRPTPNRGTAAIRAGKDTKFIRFAMTGDLPLKTLFVRYDKKEDKFKAYTLGSMERDANGNIRTTELYLGEVSAATDLHLRSSFSDLNAVDSLAIEIFYTRQPEVIDGTYHSVVHGQRQHGQFFRDEAFPAGDQAQFRDEYFYGVVRQLFSEAFPPDREGRSGSLQLGKDFDFDVNDKPNGKPIENGTQFVGQHRHLFELVEVLLGLPKGVSLSFAAELLNRSGGWERMVHKPHYVALVLYCREKGWLSGVSEDEQGVLALALALGLALKYHIKVTGFESQPNTYGQVHGQDAQRYNTAMQLAADALMPYEMREVVKFFGGQGISGSWKQKYEHLLFDLWYQWPRAELARNVSPAVFLFSGGRIKPYIVDDYFLFSYAFDFMAGAAMYSNSRHYLGRNTTATGRSLFYWAFIQGPAMNQAFFFQSTRGVTELFRKGWQYGQFVVTALQKKGALPEENSRFLSYLIATSVSSVAVGLMQTVPNFLVLGGNPLSQGFGFNEFWALYAAYINYLGYKFIKNCQTLNPEAKHAAGTTEGAVEAARAKAATIINDVFDENGTRFFRAYQLIQAGKYQEGTDILKGLVSDPATYRDMNFVLLAEKELEKLGFNLKDVPIGRPLREDARYFFTGYRLLAQGRTDEAREAFEAVVNREQYLKMGLAANLYWAFRLYLTEKDTSTKAAYNAIFRPEPKDELLVSLAQAELKKIDSAATGRSAQ
ncbi:MAG: hypothetical protein WC772_00185 [Candidatus Margulisiibacteriota bacterium]|jgi:hypothetical protein